MEQSMLGCNTYRTWAKNCLSTRNTKTKLVKKYFCHNIRTFLVFEENMELKLTNAFHSQLQYGTIWAKWFQCHNLKWGNRGNRRVRNWCFLCNHSNQWTQKLCTRHFLQLILRNTSQETLPNLPKTYAELLNKPILQSQQQQLLWVLVYRQYTLDNVGFHLLQSLPCVHIHLLQPLTSKSLVTAQTFFYG